DAGRGLLLRGLGDGRLVPLPAAESGIRIDGEQRGVVVGDLDRDGRVDLVVGQNGAETRWNRNRTAIPGIRVRLNAGPRNPDGVGAVARLETGGRRGSAWPVLAGSGWWSQSSPELVIPRPPGGEEAFLTVRWADGRSTRVELPKGADAVEVDREGLRGQVDGAEKIDRP
ncbi:MAG: VCBS repeat-containing protein, partial [Verrucomicrobiales bacterium]|nr:VCBS repeat-containing protein [Verrucomicrobiales bacterium]